MANRKDDDLFQSTSMTFGEHLEELRVSLFKAVLSLAVGFGIALWFAPSIVRLVQSPLENALEEFYSQEAVEYLNERLPPELRGQPAVIDLVLKEGLQPQEAFIAPGEILAELRKKYPGAFDKIELPPPADLPSDAKSAATATGKTGEPAAAPDDSQPAPQVASDEKSATTPAADVQKAPAGPKLTKHDLVRFFIWKPLSDDERLKLKSFNVQESFMIYIKAAFVAGAIISSPFVFYFLWSFVAAGLYPHEKRYVHLFLPASVGLFLSGALLAFTLVFPPVLRFFFAITKSMGQDLEPRISEWVSFVLLLPLGFGISFQLPLVMLFLERINIFTVQVYLSKWRIAVLVMAIASMVLSPGGDPYSMMMMLAPLVALYFGGIGLCKWLPSRQRVA